jgi:anaerobic selenocysteine-containing dehydrogenase
MTIDQSAKWVTQLRMGYFQSGVRHISEVDALLLTGNNPLVSHFGAATSNPTKAFRDAKERGAKIIVIDPRRTETARYADVHLQCLPGEDATICAGILNIILSNGWEDREFCKRFVTNLEALRESVAGYPPEYVSRRADVPAALLW